MKEKGRKIIDFHTHTFPENKSVEIEESLSKSGHVRYYNNASASDLARIMKENGIAYSVNLPVMTKPDQVFKVNDGLLRRAGQLANDGIITFGGLHPDYAEYLSEIKRLKDSGIKGIKLHPAFQGVKINDIRYKKIIYEISDAGMITIIHCGFDVSFPGENNTDIPELLDLIEDVSPQKFVLAHMGGWQNWDKVEKYLLKAPVFFDTAYSFGKVAARRGEENLLEFSENMSKERFVRIARNHGIDKILFATDSPWSSQEEYIAFVEESGLDTGEKDKVFYENAATLLKLE